MTAEQDSNRFWDVWRQHESSLRQQSLRLTRGNPANAEEILSSAMVRAAQVFPKHAVAIKNVKSWLHRLLHNVCVDAMKEGWRYSSETLPLDEEGQEASPAWNGQPSPEELLLLHERTSMMWHQVQQLPEPLRSPLLMRFHHDMPYSEIAAHLDLTQCNARKRIQLACDRLRRTLATK